LRVEPRSRIALHARRVHCDYPTYSITSCYLLSLGDCTLREAINTANLHPGADTIDFEVTGTILLDSALPDITSDLTINGPEQTALLSMARGHTGLLPSTAQ
jgi:CSLREA domain-containing protein